MATQWLEGFDRIPGTRNYGAYRRGDINLALLRHTWEGIGRTAQWHKDYVQKRMRNSRPHFVVANKHTTALAYKKSYGGSRVRVSDIETLPGFEYFGQAEPLDEVSWSLPGMYEPGTRTPRYCVVNGERVRVESNNAHIWQTEFVGYAADTPNLSDEELEWERDYWLTLCRAGGLQKLVPWEDVGTYNKIPDEELMDPKREFNFFGHSAIPPPSKHWDSGPYKYGEMADEVNKVLRQGRHSAPIVKLSAVSLASAQTADNAVEAGISSPASPAPRPQEVGKARVLIGKVRDALEDAESDLETAERLLGKEKSDG